MKVVYLDSVTVIPFKNLERLSMVEFAQSIVIHADLSMPKRVSKT